MKAIYSSLILGILWGCSDSSTNPDETSTSPNKTTSPTSSSSSKSSVLVLSDDTFSQHADANTLIDILTTNDALKALHSLSLLELSDGLTNNPSYAKERITQTQTCSTSGDIVTNLETSGKKELYNNCINDVVTLNGSFEFTQTDANNLFTQLDVFKDTPEYKIHSYLELTTTITSDFLTTTKRYNNALDYYFKSDDNEGYVNYNDFTKTIAIPTSGIGSAIRYDGVINFTSSLYPCVNGEYQFNTLEPLDADMFITDISSGVLEVNGATFRYSQNNSIEVTTTNGDTFSIDVITPPSCN